jgi:excisionase family DNA binding protein
MEMPEFLTASQVGEILHMRPDSVVRKIKRGDIPAVKVGVKWLIRREDVEALLQPEEARPCQSST